MGLRRHLSLLPGQSGDSQPARGPASAAATLDRSGPIQAVCDTPHSDRIGAALSGLDPQYPPGCRRSPGDRPGNRRCEHRGAVDRRALVVDARPPEAEGARVGGRHSGLGHSQRC